MSKLFPELFILRHGETEWNAEGRQQGQLDSPLTVCGRAQARLQGEILLRAGLAERELDAYCSPLGRARQTAGLALECIDLAPVFDQRLCEISFGDWQGLRIEEVKALRPDLFDEGADAHAWHFQSPGGEDFDALRARCLEFLHVLTGPSVLVTHGITSRVLRGIWLGLDLDGMMDLQGGQGCVYHLKDQAQSRLVA